MLYALFVVVAFHSSITTKVFFDGPYESSLFSYQCLIMFVNVFSGKVFK